MKNTKQSQDSGFSLIEVMISMTILAIVFAGAFSALYTANLINADSADRATANQLIQFEVESIRSMNWTQVSALSSTEVVVDLPDSLDAILEDEFNGNFVMSRASVAPVDNANQREITITATWTGPKHTEVSIHTLITYSKDGMSDAYYRSYN
ncbi:type IV pilus modification PilV family protein [Coraliomargarita akajimensis]|uniref:Prepilin-type N-terminal cleavage/methylation domain-containing protein n=1 Tax=Coraliomargarita akajimensis (strain DSM 45221 / IAM 15411 / JCM 23193 / KCTC 12865 / 04OKA010-24) TaxID=583355 RepID=D5EJQ0_CORAD|nr:prepilin-type N-terminal cleavage/methylation domain-containing protein [Coraliomargarita akajimensis]ADE54649.1 hypothetical protein Caka_1630 [Coraliomargarita akajimensis DSM 45221]